MQRNPSWSIFFCCAYWPKSPPPVSTRSIYHSHCSPSDLWFVRPLYCQVQPPFSVAHLFWWRRPLVVFFFDVVCPVCRVHSCCRPLSLLYLYWPCLLNSFLPTTQPLLFMADVFTLSYCCSLTFIFPPSNSYEHTQRTTAYTPTKLSFTLAYNIYLSIAYHILCLPIISVYFFVPLVPSPTDFFSVPYFGKHVRFVVSLHHLFTILIWRLFSLLIWCRLFDWSK